MKSKPCSHCGLPIAGRSSKNEHAFCCSGCHVAFHLGAEKDAEGGDRFLARVLLSAFLAMGVMVFSLSLYGQAWSDAPSEEGAVAVRGIFQLGAAVLSTLVLWLLGAPLAQAVFALRRFFSIDALVLAGATSAWGLSCWATFHERGEVYYDTATLVLVLYGLGRYLDSRAKHNAHARLTLAASDARLPVARIDESRETNVAPSLLRVNDLVRVRPGEILAVDGEVVEGQSFVDTSSLTGESQPRSVRAEERALAGWRVLDGTLVLRVTSEVGSRVFDEVERALEDAVRGKSKAVLIADRFAAALMPVVATLALWTGFSVGVERGLEAGLMRALTVVLISCPCALGIATPLAYWVALGEAWKRGILVRGSDVLERLAQAKRIDFDKTGTLTSSTLELVSVQSTGDTEDALRAAAALEQGSEHSIGRSLLRAYSGAALPPVSEFLVRPGEGVEGFVEGRHMKLLAGAHPIDDLTTVDLWVGGELAATFGLRARTLPHARSTLDALRVRGLPSRVLTGDAVQVAARIERELGVPVHARLSPKEKVEHVRATGTIFVGDGLNDTGALAAADTGISVPESSAASLEVADINLLGGDLRDLPWLIDLARRAVRTARFNLVWACSYNAIGLLLALQGKLTPVYAAIAMVLSSLFVVVGSSRLAVPSGERAEEALRMKPAPSTNCG